MTGEKDRYKTHEQLWKLEDGELSTPKHDELVLQLLNQKNSKKIVENNEWIISSSCFKESEIANSEIDTIVAAIKDTNTWYNLPVVKTEVPVHSGNNNFIIGYIDIQVKFTNFYDIFLVPSILYDGAIDIKDTNNLGPVEKYQLQNRSSNIGRVTAVNKEYRYFERKNTVYNIEVKPTIKSFGETMRQINTYRSCVCGVFAIYSPDTKFKTAFESQGVRFITPSDLGINM